MNEFIKKRLAVTKEKIAMCETLIIKRPKKAAEYRERLEYWRGQFDAYLILQSDWILISKRINARIDVILAEELHAGE